MIPLLIAATLQAGQAGASQSSSDANQGKDTTGGGLGMASKVAGAIGGTSSSTPTTVDAYGNELAPSATNALIHAFYGGETVNQLKSMGKVNIVGSTPGLKLKDDKGFYGNVHIPRKKV